MALENLGKNMKATRKAQGLSQEAVARRADLSLNVVAKIELGLIGNPHYATLAGIADALDLTVAELVGETAPKASAPLETGRPGPEPYAHIPYGPDESRADCAQARAEVMRIADEALERGDINDLSEVVYHYTDEAIEIQRLSDAEADPVYGPWVEYARRFSERWHKKIEAEDFTKGEAHEFVAMLDDFTEIQTRLGKREKAERPYYDESFGPVMTWTIRFVQPLFAPMAIAYEDMFGEENDELAAYRRRRAERYRLDSTPTEKRISNG
jgi:transcriptional regulator with XRE-family HTH domain